ncbi:MAG: hypothetical protein C0404_12075, partial [Verrucomicrobia bacterium]|nr:hypothetical protein [Verrucomicrobiota bacterium]
MATIWIWNSIASRRRSSSDTFVENGLGVLAGAVEQDGHRVRVIDWARSDFYRKLTPAIMARTARKLTLELMELSHGRRGLLFQALGALNLLLQQAMAFFQHRRMAAALRGLAREVAHSGVRIFGVKVWYGEAFFWAKYLAVEIRKLAPEVVLVAGGYHATLYEEDFLRHSPFDLAVIAEGEITLSRILRVVDQAGAAGKEAILARIDAEIEAGRLTNMIYRDGTQIRKTGKVAGDINDKTVSVYGDMTGKVRVHVLLESSGCPWGKCHFCVHHHLEPEYMRRKLDKIIDEIRLMRDQGIGLFRFAGSDTPPEFGAAIARRLLDSGMRVEYAMGSRAVKNARKPEVFEDLVEKYSLMIRSGLRAVFMGGETGHDRINDEMMNKGLGRDDLLYTMRAMRAAEHQVGRHVDIALAMIYPTPLVEGVTDADVMEQNLRLIADARPDSVMVNPPGPFKNSEWFRQRGKFG